MGVPIEDVTFELGDSSLPSAPVEGDSFTAASVGSAVKAACDKAREQLLALARKMDKSPLAKVAPDDVIFADRQIRSRNDPSKTVSLRDVMRAGKLDVHSSGGIGRASGREALLELQPFRGVRRSACR